MQATRAKSGKTDSNFTKIPNEVIFDPSLSLSEFRTYAAILSYAFGSKTEAYPTQLTLAERTGMHRETVGIAFSGLVRRRVIEPLRKGKKGQWVYKVRGLALKGDGKTDTPLKESTFERDGKADTPGDGFSDMPDPNHVGNSGTNKTEPAEEYNSKNTPPPGVASATDVTSSRGVTGNGHSAGSAADAEPDVTSSVEVNTRAEGDSGKGNAEALPTLPASQGRSNLLQSEYRARPLTRAEVNAVKATPGGEVLADSYDELEYELGTTFLPMVWGEPLNRGDLNKLVEKRGVAFCRFWGHWLSRKIADEYEKGRPVESPTGLYRAAVERGWEVNPNWPAFDETRHTVAARAESTKRQLERNLKSPHAKLTRKELTLLAEEVGTEKRQLTELPQHLQAKVRDEIGRLQEIDDEMKTLFSGAKRSDTSDDADFDFGLGSSRHNEQSSNMDELEDEIPF